MNKSSLNLACDLPKDNGFMQCLDCLILDHQDDVYIQANEDLNSVHVRDVQHD